MIVLRSPKGWTGPKVVDGLQVEGTFRAHQVPLLVDAEHPDHVKQLESWMKSYKAEELFDENGSLMPELAELSPKGDRRMGAKSPRQRRRSIARPAHAGLQRPRGECASPGAVDGQDTLVLVSSCVTWPKLNQDQRNFRIFGPDETLSNLLALFLKSPTVSGTPGKLKTTSFSRLPAGCWTRCSASTSARVGWKAIC